jgi:hypothetical protein
VVQFVLRYLFISSMVEWFLVPGCNSHSSPLVCSLSKLLSSFFYLYLYAEYWSFGAAVGNKTDSLVD